MVPAAYARVRVRPPTPEGAACTSDVRTVDRAGHEQLRRERGAVLRRRGHVHLPALSARGRAVRFRCERRSAIRTRRSRCRATSCSRAPAGRPATKATPAAARPSRRAATELACHATQADGIGTCGAAPAARASAASTGAPAPAICVGGTCGMPGTAPIGADVHQRRDCASLSCTGVPAGEGTFVCAAITHLPPLRRRRRHVRDYGLRGSAGNGGFGGTFMTGRGGIGVRRLGTGGRAAQRRIIGRGGVGGGSGGSPAECRRSAACSAHSLRETPSSRTSRCDYGATVLPDRRHLHVRERRRRTVRSRPSDGALHITAATRRARRRRAVPGRRASTSTATPPGRTASTRSSSRASSSTSAAPSGHRLHRPVLDE